MPRAARALTDRQIASTKPGRHAVGGGLYVEVRTTGSRFWVFRFQKDGVRREMGLGSYPAVTLADARRLADEAARTIASGKDPISDKQSKKTTAAAQVPPNFQDLAEEYIRIHEVSWKNEKHRAQWRSTLSTYAFPFIGNKSIDQITIRDVADLLQPIWSEKSETASRVRGRIEEIIDFGIHRGLRKEVNPATWKSRLEYELPRVAKSKRHFRSLDWRSLPSFFKRLRVTDGYGARALELKILTAARTSMVIGATWDEVDFDDRVWNLPANRMKSGRAFRVPLSTPALDLLDRMRTVRENDYVFPGESGPGLSNMTMRATLKRMDFPVTPHGFRATCKTWGEEETSTDSTVLDVVLSHQVRDDLWDAYMRGDYFRKRTAFMEAWATFAMTGHHVESGNKTDMQQSKKSD